MNIRQLLAATSLSLTCGLAAAEPPSAASVETLLTLSKVESLIQSLWGNMEQNMRQGMMQAAGGRTLTPEQQRVFDAAPRKFAQVMREELNWGKLKPIYIEIYRDSFTQKEIDGLNAFYRTPVGQSYIAKMPGVMQKSSVAVQGLLGPLVEKMRTTMQEAMTEAKMTK